jgi:hypothetical protein
MDIAIQALLASSWERAMNGYVLGLFLFAASTFESAFAVPRCRPALSITHVAFSEVRPATMERRWTATVAADASHCASKAGYFEIGFLREKENAPPLEFREQFIWIEPTSLVGIDVWVDEAIEHAWIDSVQTCTCAK